MNRIFTKEDANNAFGAGGRRQPAAGSASDPILDGLNPNQRRAATTLDGPVRILAGAGTGKTTVLIRRIANLIRQGRARPEEILAVTFTKKAAAEMRERLADMLGADTARRIHAGNFHAISSEMLRRHAHLLNLPSRFTVLNEEGQKDVIGELALQLGLLRSKKDKTRIMNFLGQIASWKEDGHDVASIQAQSDLVAATTGASIDDAEFLRDAATVFAAYQAETEHRRWCDFADLVLHMVRLFRAHPEVRAEEAGHYRYIVVDEFQDTSPVQNEWVTCMARDHRNICVVGDTDQSIYEWRNARPDIMMGFPEAWPGCSEITIDTNYRSTQEILEIANEVVAPLRLKDRLDKALTSPRRGDRPAELLRSYDSGFEEADAIADGITAKLDGGEIPSEIAVLCRTGMIITGIEKALREHGIRYVVAGAMKFTDREEIKDAVAWLTLAANPLDYTAFTRIAAKPSRGIGPQKVSEIRRAMMENGCTVREAVDQLAAAARKGSANARHYREFAAILAEIDAIVTDGADSGEILGRILETTGYWEWRNLADNDPQRDQRMDNLSMLLEEAAAYRTPMEFLEMLALQAGADKGWGDDCVVVSTVHAAKGLEFDIVFTPAMEEGIFPNARAQKTVYGADEERRLAHVAWTRARRELRISWAGYRMGGQGSGTPSPYLAECGLLGPPNGSAPRGNGPRRLRRRKF